MCPIPPSVFHLMVKSAICPSAIRKNTTVKVNRVGERRAMLHSIGKYSMKFRWCGRRAVGPLLHANPLGHGVPATKTKGGELSRTFPFSRFGGANARGGGV